MRRRPWRRRGRLAGPERFHKKEGWVALLLPQQYPCLYNAAKSLLLWQDIPERAHVKHVFVKTATRVNNRAGNSRQPTRRRERQMCSFRDARRTQALPRHQMSAVCHRAVLKERFATWHGWTITGAVEKII